MKRYHLLSLILTFPALAVLLSAAGCGGGTPTPPPGPGTGPPVVTTKKDITVVDSKGWGTIKGKVTFDGDPPPIEDLKPRYLKDKPTDAPHCDMGSEIETTNPYWRVGPDKGVANVLVWLRAGRGRYFNIPDDQKKRDDVVTIEQPYCAFMPHVFALYPSYYDPDSKAQKPTGQGFKVVNNATIPHNTNINFGDATINAGFSRQMPAAKKQGEALAEEKLTASPSKPKDAGGEQTVTVACNIHPWMSASGRVFDHPFVAVTSGGKKDDKDFGSYEIKNAPAGAKIELVYWHESMKAPKVLKEVTLKDGEAITEDIKISK